MGTLEFVLFIVGGSLVQLFLRLKKLQLPEKKYEKV